LFKVHRKNLEVHSEIFATAESISATAGPISDLPVNKEIEVVQLSETSTVLDLLLQFMYRQPQPDLSHLPFETLADLVKAVEKYEIFSAMFNCKSAMRYVQV